MPGPRDQDRVVKMAMKDAQGLLEALRTGRRRGESLPDGAAGRVQLIRAPTAQGTAIGLEGRLVHAALFPQTPLEEALFSRPLELPPGESSGEESFGALERREERGTLSEEEKRLLDRMRQRRGR